MTSSYDQLSGGCYVEDGVAVVTVRGVLDAGTVTRFQAILEQALAAASRVVVDLPDLMVRDPDALTVLATAAARLRAAGGALQVRELTPRTSSLIEMAGLTDALGVQHARGPDPGLVRELVGASHVPHVQGVLDAALQMVVTMAQAVVLAADGASITLPRNGRLGTVAASNDTIMQMDDDQYATGQGPCLDAATRGERFIIHSLQAESRWPAFVPRARARGINSILSTPLLAADLPIGALNLYSRETKAFAAHETRWADQFALQTARVVTSALPDPETDVRTGQIQQALQSREVIAQAQGRIMERDQVSSAAAYRRLLEASRRTGRPLRDVAEGIVTAHSPFSEDPTGPAPDAGDGSAHGQPTP